MDEWISAPNVTKVGFYLMADAEVENVVPQWVEVWSKPYDLGPAGHEMLVLLDRKGNDYKPLCHMSESVLFLGPIEHPQAEY